MRARQFDYKQAFSPKLVKINKIFKDSMEGTDATDVSLQERIGKQLLDQKTFTYGEAIFDTFVPILNFAEPKKGEIFMDLGCGGG